MTRLAILSLLLAACAAPVGTSGAVSAPRDSAPQCASICHDIGLTLDSVVVMANNVGCVCSAAMAPARAEPNAKAGSAAGGMAAIMIQQESQQHHNAAAAHH